MPQNPKGAGSEVLNTASPEIDPMWTAIEDSGLPVCFHVGEFFQEGPGTIGTTNMVNLGAPFRKNFGELIFGGIFGRHPDLRVVFVEGDINWIPGVLQVAEYVCSGFSEVMEPKIKHEPRHYWETNCYATFMVDPVGLRLLDLIGADRVMWSSDYPHVESAFGFTWEAMQNVVDAVSAEDARKILGGTALDLFNLL